MPLTHQIKYLTRIYKQRIGVSTLNATYTDTIGFADIYKIAL